MLSLQSPDLIGQLKAGLKLEANFPAGVLMHLNDVARGACEIDPELIRKYAMLAMLQIRRYNEGRSPFSSDVMIAFEEGERG